MNFTNPRSVYRLCVPVIFHSGLAPGAGKCGGNLLETSRDGQGRHILRGTAIAGVLRHAWASKNGFAATPTGQDDEVARWFGFALGDDGGEHGGHNNRPSPLHISDAILQTGNQDAEIRQHNMVDRHVGAVRDGGLFAVEFLPPGTHTTVVLHLHHEEDEAAASEFCDELVELFGEGLSFGGNTARGIGLAEIGGDVRRRRFNLMDLNDLAAWLDVSWQWRENGIPCLDGEILRPEPKNNKCLKAKISLVIPAGQDICIGSGTGDEFSIEPQQVTHADGKRYWRLPGSSLRGVFRAWFNRLAAREACAGGEKGKPADSVERFLDNDGKPSDGKEIGWNFDGDEERKRKIESLENGACISDVVSCPVARLFGSLYGAGRIHISDALALQDSGSRTQPRKHVAIDRITGGANEGFLFDHAALLPGSVFSIRVLVHDPEEHEVRWLAQTLRALDLGLIRIGSAKSSGRLALHGRIDVTGPHAEILQTIENGKE
jgi:CRISPR/Cas system CSM-associated protein Csm3 (group 7 of RAMP superfamily)